MKGLNSWGNVNLGHVMDHWKVSERDIKLCLMKSVVKLVMFLKRVQQTCLPDYSTHMKLNMPAMEKSSVPCGSFIGRFHCICDFIAKWKIYVQIFFCRNV
jgi:hypothetical protein